MHKLSYDEKALCRKTGDVFEYASTLKYNPFSFAKAWCSSTISEQLYNLDCDKIAQGRKYIFNDVDKHSLVKNGTGTAYDANLMYWLGYSLTYASFSLHLPPREIYKKYDISKYICSYDVLHTLSSSRMVEELQNEYDIANNINDLINSKLSKKDLS